MTSRVALMVREWYEQLPKRIRNAPTASVPAEEARLVIMLLDEVVRELEAGLAAQNVVEVADALADIVYVAYGAAAELGVDLDAVLEEVHKANVSKHFADGHYEFDADGKVTRGSEYVAPSIAELLGVDERTM